MTTYIGLLRGINVGGKRSFKMAELRGVIERAGGSDVATYIQSGNVVFDHPERSATKLQADLEQTIGAAAGFPVPVILRTARQLGETVSRNPLSHGDEKNLHVTFFADKVVAGAVASIDRTAFQPEEFAIVGRDVYMHLPNGMGRSKLAVTLARLLPNGTARNWRTVTTLVGMAGR